jgi:hypothetical protein
MVGDIEPVRVMGAEGYPNGFNALVREGALEELLAGKYWK